MYRTSTAISVVVLALAAWGLVGYFAWTITRDEDKRVMDGREAQLVAIQNAQAIRTHALALDTATDGAKLKNLLDLDVVSVSNMIEEAGRSAGVKVKLGNAQPERGATSDGLTIRAVGFIITADGKFSELLRAARLFEALPIPSSVTRLDIERAPASFGGAPSAWHLNAYIRVLTTSDISS